MREGPRQTACGGETACRRRACGRHGFRRRRGWQWWREAGWGSAGLRRVWWPVTPMPIASCIAPPAASRRCSSTCPPWTDCRPSGFNSPGARTRAEPERLCMRPPPYPSRIPQIHPTSKLKRELWSSKLAALNAHWLYWLHSAQSGSAVPTCVSLCGHRASLTHQSSHRSVGGVGCCAGASGRVTMSHRTPRRQPRARH